MVEICKVPDESDEDKDDLTKDSDVLFVHFSKLHGSPVCFDKTVQKLLEDLKWARDYEMEESDPDDPDDEDD